MTHRSLGRGLPAVVVTAYVLAWQTASLAHADYDFSLSPAHPSRAQSQGGGAAFQTDEFTGAFGYAIPIELSPGRSGATPSLALSYSSSGGNGWIGVGWSLDVGFIERDGKDGVPIKWATTPVPAPITPALLPVSPLQYDDTKGFTFSLQGKASRLVLTNDVTKEYRPERDTDGLRFLYKSTGWEVYDKAGTKYTFGSLSESPNSVMTNPETTAAGNAKTYRWGLSSSTDTNNNRVLYEYEPPASFSNQLYLKRIQYNGHTSQAAPYTHSVDFTLEDRKDASLVDRDNLVSYRTGYKVETKKRLKAMTVSVCSNPASCAVTPQRARRYDLAYTQSPSTGRSLLHTVTELGKQGTTRVHDPITLEYQEQTFSFAPPILWGNSQGRLLTDPQFTEEANLRNWNGIAWSTDAQCAFQTGSRQVLDLGDMDRDGLPDRVLTSYLSPSRYLVQHNTATEGFFGAGFDEELRNDPFQMFGSSEVIRAFRGALGWRYPDGVSRMKLIDLNGDGYPDRLHDWKRNSETLDLNDAAAVTQALNLFVEYGNGAGFGALTTFGPIKNHTTNPNISYVVSTWNSPEYSFTDNGAPGIVGTMTDINGDGLPDRVLRLGTEQSTPRDHFLVQINTLRTAGSTGLSGLQRWSFDNRYQNEQYFWNNPFTFETDATSTNSSTAVGMFDINGDGLPDRLMRMVGQCGVGGTYDNFVVQYNKGYGFEEGVTPTGTPFFGPLQDPGTGYSRCAYASPTTSEDPGTAGFNAGSFTLSMLQDVNGDGLLDRIVQDVVPHLPSGTPRLWVQVNEGTHFADMVPYGGMAVPSTALCNGQGVGPWQYIQASMPWPWPCEGAQVNCGGPNNLEFGNIEEVQYRDINGDGLPDRILANPNPTNNAGLLVQLAEGDFPDLLWSVENGIGGKLTAHYKPSTAWINRDIDYNPMVQTPWQAGAKSLLSSVMQTVSEITVDDGVAAPGTTTYQYFGGMFDYIDREFRGFHRTTRTSPNGQQTITWFHQDGGMDHASLGEFQDTASHFKRGMPFRIETRGGSSHTLYNVVLNKVEEVPLSSVTGQRSRWFPFVSQTSHLAYEGLAQNLRRVSVAKFQYYPPSNSFANNLWKHTRVGEVVGFIESTHGYAAPTSTQNADDSVMELTYAAITGNTDIKDRVDSQFLENFSGTKLQKTDSDYFDSTGNLRAFKRCRDLTADLWLEETFTYDPYGNIVDHTQPGDSTGNITTHRTWDPNYNAFPFQVTEDSTGTLNYTTTTIYDELSGHVETSADWNQLTTRHIYDNFNRLEETWLDIPEQSSLWQETFIYTLFGAASGVSSNFTEHRTNDASPDAQGYHQTFTYADGLGRTIQARVESEVAGQFRVTNSDYDENGDLVHLSQEHFEPGSGFQPFAGGPGTTFAYDDLGRVRWTFPPSEGAHQLSIYYNGYLPAFYSLNDPWAVITLNDQSSVPSPLGREKREYHDGQGRAFKIEEVTAAGTFATNYKYDVAGNLTEITDHLGNKTIYTYDSLNRRLTTIDPDLGAWSYEYYDSGRPKSQTDPVGQPALPGQKTQHQYDHLGRPVTMTVYEADGVTVGETISYVYDANNDGTSATYPVFKGQLFKVTDKEGFQRSGYDIRSNLLKTLRKVTANGKSYITDYTYDVAQRVKTMSFPKNDGVLQYTYDLGGNVQKVEAIAGIAPEVFYDANQFNGLGQLQSVTYGNGVTTTYTYFASSKRLQNLRASLGTTDYLNLSYTYDYASNVKSITDGTAHTGLASGSRSSINYDRLHRLVSYSRPDTSGIDFTYDATGNMTSNEENGGAYTYPPSGPNSVRPHAVTNGTTYGYDAVGNMTSRPGQTLAYNARNMLEQVSISGGPVMTYGYDASGNRLWKKQNGAVKTVWIGSYFEDRGSSEFCHVIVEGHRVCTFEVAKFQQPGGPPPLFRYSHSDPLNTANAQTNQDGSLAQEYQYAAYGDQTYEMDPGASELLNRFTDQILDVETGLYYYGARYYDPQLGRFIQADTVTPDTYDPQQLNRYTYVNNNPFKYIDPTGHWAQEDNWWSQIGRGIARDARWIGGVATGAGKAAAGLAHSLWNLQETLEGVLPAIVDFDAGEFGDSLKHSAQQILAGDPEAIGAAGFNVLAGGAALKAVGMVGGVARGSLLIEEAAEAGSVTARAAELRAAIPAAQQGRITMSVGLAEEANGARRVLIGTSEPRGYLRPGVTLAPGETLVAGLGHAEANIVNFAQQGGLRLLQVGATRPICPPCAALIGRTGAQMVTPLKVP